MAGMTPSSTRKAIDEGLTKALRGLTKDRLVNLPIWPAYFASLAATAGPDEYVSRVSALVRAHASGRHERLLRPVRKVANNDQRRQLRASASSLRLERR